MKKITPNIPSKGEIAIFQAKDKNVQLEVKLEQETVWLSLNQLVTLFSRDKSVISRHLLNVFKTRELERNSVVANFATTAVDGKVYQVDFYNLDAIISVGYRVNSKRGTQFRIWATNVLRKYIIEGYALNQKRLKEKEQKLDALQRAIELIASTKSKKELDYREALGLIEVIRDYSLALGILDDYDYKKLSVNETSKTEKFKLTYEEVEKAVRQMRAEIGGSHLFAQEKDQSFKSSILSIYQTFGGKDLYPSVEEKAANLLYFIVKNHSFVDGNKRIAASIFIWYLKENGLLYKAGGTKRIADNALVALTLMIAESDPKDRDVIVMLTVNLINKNN